jgi:aromatase
MKGRTENSVVVYGDAERIFELTNRIELWPELFTEYESTEVLEREGHYLKFRLTMFPEEDGKVKSWVSERTVDTSKREARAKRLEPMYPFASMDIHWTYEPLPQGLGVIMTWIQEFEPHENFPFDVYRMESHLNHNTRIQLKAVKQAVEERLLNAKGTVSM